MACWWTPGPTDTSLQTLKLITGTPNEFKRDFTTQAQSSNYKKKRPSITLERKPLLRVMPAKRKFGRPKQAILKELDPTEVSVVERHKWVFLRYGKTIKGKQWDSWQVDLQKVMDAYGNDESDTEEADDTSLRSVLGALPMFKEERSRVVTMIEDRTDRFGNKFGHVCNFSSKHHCEVAGQGIEYDNGRSKWWYRSHCEETVGGMRKNAALSVSKSVITLVHSMKFARKARDFMRAYRTGSMGKDVEKHSREFRAHRCMLNCFFTFVSED